jgi:hypothetical protein
MSSKKVVVFKILTILAISSSIPQTLVKMSIGRVVPSGPKDTARLI